MADDVNTDVGTIAADEIGGVKFQRIKITWGVDGAWVDSSVTDPFPVQVAKPIPAGLNNIGKVDVASLPKGRASGANSTSVTTSIDELKVTEVTVTTDTSAYAAGDLIAETQAVLACMKADDAPGMLQSVTVLDESDQGAAFTIYFLDQGVTFGTENAAPTITDANARAILGFVSIDAADYKDIGGCRVACKTGIGLMLKPQPGSDDIWIAIVNGAGTPTYAADALKLRLGIVG